MSETLRISLLILDLILVTTGLFLLYLWAIRPELLQRLLIRTKLTLRHLIWFAAFTIAILLSQLIPYTGDWVDEKLQLGSLLCGSEQQWYCYGDKHRSK